MYSCSLASALFKWVPGAAKKREKIEGKVNFITWSKYACPDSIKKCCQRRHWVHVKGAGVDIILRKFHV